MRRALGVPVVARRVSPLVAEVLEDRTVLSGVTGSAESGATWADLLASNSPQTFVVPAGLVERMFQGMKTASAETDSAPLSPTGVSSPAVSFQIDADAAWPVALAGQFPPGAVSGEFSQAVIVVEFDDNADRSEGRRPFVNIRVSFVSDVVGAGDPLTSGGASVDFLSDAIPTTVRVSPRLEGRDDGIGARESEAADSSLTGISNRQLDVAESNAALQEVASESNGTLLSATPRGSQSRVGREPAEFNLAGLGNELSTFSFIEPFNGAPSSLPKRAAISAAAHAVSFRADVNSAAWGAAVASASSKASLKQIDFAAVAMRPVDGLQAAATPLVVVVETVAATLDAAARAVMAMFGGAAGGGASSPVAPVVQPAVDPLRVMLDPQRPRWALHDGLVEKLAAYSLAVAPEQHFDLRDFGPPTRVESGGIPDEVVRIEFDMLPQHGRLLAGTTPGSFRYSPDPGFSGVDGAKFRVIRASGESVTGLVTVFVEDRTAPAKQPAPVRQVDLPALDQRVSDARESAALVSPAAAAQDIDALFQATTDWVDWP